MYKELVKRYYGFVESDNWDWDLYDIPEYAHITHWMPIVPLPEPPKEEA